MDNSKRLRWVSVGAVLLVECGVATARAEIARPQTGAGKADVRVTVIGCVHRSAPSPESPTNTTAIPVGGTRYLLSDITLAGDNDRTNTAGAAATADLLSEAVKTYRLDDSADALIAPHVGDRVEVTGTVVTRSPVGTTGITESAKSPLTDSPLLRVEKLRTVSSTSAVCAR